MEAILEISTEKGKLKEGQFVTYKVDENVNVYKIIDVDNFNAFYPSENGSLITINVKDNDLILNNQSSNN